jgi:hypothetical protein
MQRLGGRCVLSGLRRKGLSFNYMGNLVTYDEVHALAAEALEREDFSLQLELTPGERGTDLLIAHVFGAQDRGNDAARLQEAFCASPDFREGYEKRAGRVEVRFEPWIAAELSGRQKQKPVIDRRGRAS